MGWGDLFVDRDEKLGENRLALMISQGYVPGALISYGRPTLETKKDPGRIHVWTQPWLGSESFDVTPGVGVILSVDCESDPSDDWLCIWLTTLSGKVGAYWLPTKVCTLRSDP